ncbi:hypothetical protein EH30_11025 [Erythrobacter sp. JL475]|nr:hypothetical protein EH30_11025 [Erythrobacter sp. JL475]
MLQLLASEYRMIAQDILAIMLLAAAFIWGGGPERAVAASWFIIFKVSSFVRETFFTQSLQLMEVDFFLASTDIAAVIAFVWIALYANRNYPLWIAAMQVLAVSAHLARGLVESISPIGYIVMIVAPGWFQLFVLAFGLARHVSRKRKYGPYRDWRKSQPPPGLAPPAAGSTAERMVLKSAQTSWRDNLK